MVLFVAFFAVHVIQVAIAGWANFRSMISGYDVVETETVAVSKEMVET